MVTFALVPNASLVLRPLTVPATALTLTNCAEPYCVELIRRSLPLTWADRPVAFFTPLIAVAIELTVVPEANDNCCVPRFPATSSVTVEPVIVPPVYPTAAVVPELTTCTATATVLPSGIAALLIFTSVRVDAVTPLVV